ncbi:hypothetical protein GALMADRAFT_262501 [Galerina marginata CBS 339.88]|uniref:Cell division control protein 14 n=1 Tax=Galerina marginata (strain CBS 339.88) TaxID=685588 RepID=A0A067TLP5_GALM3|nr:hypothetical protein GALMADRAFT_262501 [Galerina marginata CBS 339.88]
MAFEEVMDSMRDSVQCALDELISPRSSSKSKMKSLQTLEKILANACFNTKNDSEAKDAFLALQYTFECNVPSHLLSSIIMSTSRLETITNRGLMEGDQVSEADELASQLALSLSLIQGIVLNHAPCKIYLGRRGALEVLLDLLLASRYLAEPAESAESAPKSSGPLPLTSVVLDTLLCILVDSTVALRAFEESSGVQAIVKILKRAGTPREVRMKCLEFLYFYLLDETPASGTLKSTQPSPPPTRPATPIRPPKPYLSATPMRPTSRYGSSTFSFSSSTTAGLSTSLSSTSSRSTSGSSSHSFSSTSSNASSSTDASSMPASPVKDSFPASLPKTSAKSPGKRLVTPFNQQHSTPPNSPPLSSGTKPPQLRSMMMLRKDVDYVPQSPKKPPGLGTRPTHRKSLSTPLQLRSRSQMAPLGSGNDEQGVKRVATDDNVITGRLAPEQADLGLNPEESKKKGGRDGGWKTTEEKKQLLGTMLGNVDALVEGVRKAGIWGLG